MLISNENVSCFQKNTYMYQHIEKMTREKDAFLWHFPETSVAPRLQPFMEKQFARLDPPFWRRMVVTGT